MNFRRLIWQSFRYYWRTHFGAAAGAAVGAAVLVGALAVGDCVEYTLQWTAQVRLGETQLVMHAPDRYFTVRLADDLQNELNTAAAAILHQPAVAMTPDQSARANVVQVYGVENRFWRLSPKPSPQTPALQDAEVLLSETLARRLDVAAGDVLVLRIEKPSTLPRDMPLADDEQTLAALRVTVKDILTPFQFGRFGLRAEQTPPDNAFVSLSWLQSELNLSDKVNLMLIGGSEGSSPMVEQADAAIKKHWRLADVELELAAAPDSSMIELRSRRVFLDDPIVQAAGQLTHPDQAPPLGVLSYFVNAIRHNGRETPYSIVSAVGPLGDQSAESTHWSIDPTPLSPINLSNDAVVINQWLANDLSAKVGDEVEIDYYTLSPQRRLVEKTIKRTVRAVAPIERFTADASLMPAFPGIADAVHCRDWRPGVSIDLKRIRDKDELYWDQYRGAPKAFIALNAGQSAWANRFGSLTAVRFNPNQMDEPAIRTHLLSQLDPATVGLRFNDVRQSAFKAGREGVDFGGLFAAMSIFVMVGAVLLCALLFIFNIEQRREQIGVLLAMGWTPGGAVRWLIGEGFIVCAVGVGVGAIAGLGYTKLVLWALTSIWRSAVNDTVIYWRVEPSTVLLGAGISLIVSVAAMRWTLHRLTHHLPRELLASDAHREPAAPPIRGAWSLWLAGALVFLGAWRLFNARQQSSLELTMAFFGCGVMLLTAGLLVCRWLLGRLAAWSPNTQLTPMTLALRQVGRRSGRSLAILSMLAIGVFLIIAIQAFHQTDDFDPTDRTTGTGGFTLFAQTQLPVLADLNNADQRDALNLDWRTSSNVRFAPLRVHQGDDASCLNLNRAQQPRLIAVNPDDFGPSDHDQRPAFTFEQWMNQADDAVRANPWSALDEVQPDGAVPGVADKNTVIYALGKKVGDTIAYVDERGRPFEVRLVAMVSNSILQGDVIISQNHFTQRFPSASGYEMFLIETTAEHTDDVSKSLSRSLSDWGMQVSTTRNRLAMFSAVMNTYLTIFQALGGLGLALGAAGVGAVVLRNVLERRHEFAMLLAVGFSPRLLRRLIFYEHAGLLIAGVTVGVLSAGATVAPAIPVLRESLPGTLITICAVLASGVLWIYLAAYWAMRGKLSDALNEP